MKLTKEESYKVQIIRGLAIIAVVCIHNTPSGMAQVLWRPFLNFAVAIFLFISGMLSNAQKWSPAHRIKKIIIPYIIWTTIYTILFCHDSFLKMSAQYAKNLVTGRAAAIMYYVFVYCEFTLLIPLMDRLARSKYKYLGFVFAPLEIAFVRIVPMLIGYQMNQHVNIIVQLSCLGWFSYFYLGYLIGNSYLHIEFSTQKLIFGLGGGITLQILEGMWYLSLEEANCGTQLKLSVLLTNIFVLLLAYRFIKSDKAIHAKFLYLLGNCSFGVYFLHLAVMWILDHIPNYAQVVYPLNAAIVVVTSLFLVIAGKKVFGKYARYLAL